MAFSLEMYPISYIASYDDEKNKWKESWFTADTIDFSTLKSLSAEEQEAVYTNRNNFPLPLVNYTTQYGLSCFEGMKAFPTKDNKVSIFRPDCNAKRFASSMKGLYAPEFPTDLFVKASLEFVRKNAQLGYIPSYDTAWEKDNFANAQAVYLRPFMYSEAGIGVGISRKPYVIICATTVSSYFTKKNSKAITTDRIRATPHGTGYIKCASNYVISTLAKKEAEEQGFMEVIFLDAIEKKYIEEGSSCNIFFQLKDGSLVTPELSDTILPGITRKSIIELALSMNIAVSERKISIDEVFQDVHSCFVTGTAAGITYIESITHNNKEVVFNDRKQSDLSLTLQKTIKGIQYGAIEDQFNWNFFI
ncbi:MAG: branched-chain-amino-acid transaminase [Treponemataceae bacterium]